MHSGDDALPYMDKALPDAWKAAGAFAAVVSKETAKHGLTLAESEIVKVRVSQLNGCVFCLDLHSRQARKLGVPQQKLDLLPAWREATLFSSRETALLAVAEAATELLKTAGQVRVLLLSLRMALARRAHGIQQDPPGYDATGVSDGAGPLPLDPCPAPEFEARVG